MGFHPLRSAKGPDTRCNIACNIARNVAEVEASSTSATFHATIAPCVHPIARNVARNVASCVRSLRIANEDDEALSLQLKLVGSLSWPTDRLPAIL